MTEFDWFNKPGLEKPGRGPGPGRFFYTTRRYPLFYLQITKCGCTFLRNLLYYLDHDEIHPDSARIHAHEEDFLKADRIPRRTLRESRYMFAVIRDPVDRFLSLYFDKLVNLENRHDVGMRTRVAKAAGLRLAPDLDLADHRENCLKTLNWFEVNLAGDAGKPNPHWQRQSLRLKRISELEPHLLTLSGLSWQLPKILDPLIPDIAEKMDAVRVRNESRKPLSRAEIMTPEIAAAVLRVYPEDSETYVRVAARWGKGPRQD